MGQLVAQAQGDIVRSGVLLHRDTCNVWIKLHAEACAAAVRGDALRVAFMRAIQLDECKLPGNAAWPGGPAFSRWEAEVEKAMAVLEADYSLVDAPARRAAPAQRAGEAQEGGGAGGSG
eukprot:g7752.t1